MGFKSIYGFIRLVGVPSLTSTTERKIPMFQMKFWFSIAEGKSEYEVIKYGASFIGLIVILTVDNSELFSESETLKVKVL